MKMKKYSWNFDKDAEMWYNDDFDTIEECIADAKISAEAEKFDAEVVYIGENVPFKVAVDAANVLEQLQEEACEFCGEVGADWNAFNPKKQEELTELDEKLTVVVKEWMAKYGYAPNLYSVMNISAHRLKESSR